jgi:hypothetical protein
MSMDIRSIAICIGCLSTKVELEKNDIKKEVFLKRIKLYLDEISLLIPLDELKNYRKKVLDFLGNKDINRIMKHLDKYITR